MGLNFLEFRDGIGTYGPIEKREIAELLRSSQ